MRQKQGSRTHASSNPLMASLIPSAPIAKVPYGSLDEPDMLLSSDTRSDSSLRGQLSLWNVTKPKKEGLLTEAPRKHEPSGQQQGSYS